MGMWEASMNNTHRAVDMIPKNVMICDWHYERPDKSAVYFAMKGLDVVTCPWRNPPVAIAQAADMVKFRMESTEEMKNHFQGMVQTVWSGNSEFLDGFYGRKVDAQAGEKTDYNCFQKLFPKPNEATKETQKNQRKRK